MSVRGLIGGALPPGHPRPGGGDGVGAENDENRSCGVATAQEEFGPQPAAQLPKPDPEVEGGGQVRSKLQVRERVVCVDVVTCVVLLCGVVARYCGALVTY